MHLFFLNNSSDNIWNTIQCHLCQSYAIFIRHLQRLDINVLTNLFIWSNKKCIFSVFKHFKVFSTGFWDLTVHFFWGGGYFLLLQYLLSVLWGLNIQKYPMSIWMPLSHHLIQIFWWLVSLSSVQTTAYVKSWTHLAKLDGICHLKTGLFFKIVVLMCKWWTDGSHDISVYKKV